MIIGLTLEGIRRLLRLAGSFHLRAAALVLLLLVGYLAYSVVAADLENVDPSEGLPEGYRPPLFLWWWGLTVPLCFGVVALAGRVGFFRNQRTAIRWLLTLVITVVAFHLVDLSLPASFPRLLFTILVVVGGGGVGLFLRWRNVSPVQMVKFMCIAAILATAVMAVYFGWPGKNYDRHLVVFVWDAVPAQRMGIYGYHEENTPELSSWRDRMVIFEKTYSPANYTFASHVSIFTGRYLREHHLYNGTRKDMELYSGYGNLAEAMAERGWRPILLTENPWLMAISKGFAEKIDCPTRFHPPRYFLPFYRDTFLGRQAVAHLLFTLEGSFKRSVMYRETRLLAEWLLRARREGPYFIFTNWMYFHSRYHPEIPDAIPIEKRPQKASDDCIRFMDVYLKKWLDIIAAAGQLEESLFILTADHGELLGEHGLFGHGKTLLEPVLHVPLLLFGPHVKPARVVRPVPLVALKSAIESLVPLSPEKGWNQGKFIERFLNNRGMVVEGSYDFEGPENSIRWYLAAWEGSSKYVQDIHAPTPNSLEGRDTARFLSYYDLASDPEEMKNLAASRPDEVAQMRQMVSEWEKYLDPAPLPPPEKGEEDEYPPGLVEQLRALGYMR